jgi:tetratricopeptide (TPR) repeat protein
VQEAPERESFANLAFAYAKSGRREKAQEMLRELQEASSRRYIDPISFAIIHAGLGENDQALDSLEKAFKDRSGPPYFHLPYIALNVLRSDPRWANFAQRKGLAH